MGKRVIKKRHALMEAISLKGAIGGAVR